MPIYSNGGRRDVDVVESAAGISAQRLVSALNKGIRKPKYPRSTLSNQGNCIHLQTRIKCRDPYAYHHLDSHFFSFETYPIRVIQNRIGIFSSSFPPSYRNQ